MIDEKVIEILPKETRVELRVLCINILDGKIFQSNDENNGSFCVFCGFDTLLDGQGKLYSINDETLHSKECAFAWAINTLDVL